MGEPMSNITRLYIFYSSDTAQIQALSHSVALSHVCRLHIHQVLSPAACIN